LWRSGEAPTLDTIRLFQEAEKAKKRILVDEQEDGFVYSLCDGRSLHIKQINLRELLRPGISIFSREVRKPP